MAPNDLQKQFNAFLTSTMERYRSTLADNIFRSNAVLAKLDQAGAITEQSGGSEIIQPLMYGENETVKAYRGYEELDTTPQDGITAAEYDWKQIAGTISISRRERRLNSGEQQLLNLLEKKIKQAEMSIQQKVNDFLINSFDEGTDGKQLTPIPKFVAVDPTSGARSQVGEIDGANQTWWRNATKSSSATSDGDLKEELYQVYNQANRGGMNSRVDMVLADQGTFERYELALDAQQRYRNDDMADMGFENLRLKGATIFWDDVVPDATNTTEFDTTQDYDEGSNPSTGTAYFLNTNHMEFVIDSETRFETTEFTKPHDQDAFVSQILFMGELTLDNRRKFGVLHDIDRF